MNKIIQIGAGKIGRAVIGRVFNKNNYHIVYADINNEIINKLKKIDDYTLIDQQGSKDIVDNFSAYNSQTELKSLREQLQRVDFITVSVGIQAIPAISNTVSDLLKYSCQNKINKNLCVIAFENSYRATSKLKEAVYKSLTEDEKEYVAKYVNFLDAAVDGIIPDQEEPDDLTLKVESYYELVIEKPEELQLELKGVEIVYDIEPYINRKLFVVNMGHACIAWAGYYYGYTDIIDAVEDPRVVSILKQSLEESKVALQNMYKDLSESIDSYVQAIYNRFVNNTIKDDIARVGRNPHIKLSKDERFLTPATNYFNATGDIPKGLTKSIALGFYYLADLENLSKEQYYDTVREVTGLDKDSSLFTSIIKELNDLRKDSDNNVK